MVNRDTIHKDQSAKLSLIALFAAFPLQNILLYQIYFWGLPEHYRKIVFFTVDGTIVFYLSVLLVKELSSSPKNLSKNGRVYTFLTFILLLLLIVLSHFKNEELRNYNLLNLQWIGLYYFYFITGFFLSRNYSVIMEFRWLLVVGQILMSLQILLFFNIDSISINYDKLEGRGYIHLFLGSSYAIWSILTLVCFDGWKRISVYITTLPFLFMLGSRAAFYFYILIFPILFWDSNRRKRRIVDLVFLVSAIITCVLVIQFEIFGHRMLQVFSIEDPSRMFRRQIMEANMPGLKAHWLAGDYGGFVQFQYPANIYPHNLLGFWSQFGLLPFLLLIVLLANSIVSTVKMYFNSKKSYTALFLCLLVYNLAMTIFARGHDYPTIFLFIGLTSCHSLIINRRELTNSKNNE